MVEKQIIRRRGDALRDQVLNTALRLFSERGYFNTSVHDIRRTAGVRIGAVYHHFQSKEMLVKSLYWRLVARMETAIVAACAGQSGCLARSRAIIV